MFVDPIDWAVEADPATLIEVGERAGRELYLENVPGFTRIVIEARFAAANAPTDTAPAVGHPHHVHACAC